jgi:hypothetical protein
MDNLLDVRVRLVGAWLAPAICAVTACASTGSNLGPSSTSAPGSDNPVRPTGSWAVAASGDYQGHHWVRFTTAGTDGVCYALNIDGISADAVGPSLTTIVSGAVVAPTVPGVASALYQGHRPSCGLLRGIVQNGLAVAPTPIDLLNGQRMATATDFGYVSGIVAHGSAVVATLDDGSKVSMILAGQTFTLFYGQGRRITHLGTQDASGKTILDCTVSTTPPFDGMTSLVSDC